MKSHKVVFSFLLVITISIVYGSLLNNFPNVYSQVFEIDENDYFEFDDTTSNTNDPSEEFAKTGNTDGNGDKNQDKKGDDSKKSKKKSKKISEDDPASYTTSQYSGKYDIKDVQQHYVQKFDSDGNFLLSWGQPQDKNLFSHKMEDVKVDVDDNVWVVDWGVGKVYK